ncbi:MAG: SCO family protein [Chromatiales bacterium]|nr:MAG: SCO family protein [Chromatiales bacterium]
MSPKNLVIAAAVAVALAAGIFLAIRSTAPAVPASALILPEPEPVPQFSLLNQDGDKVDQSVFEGQWDLVFFGFTHCPDICPTTLQVLATAKQTLAGMGQQPLPRIVLVSVDPERDTPEILGQYVDYFGDGNLGLTGTIEEIRKLTTELGVYFEKRGTEGDNYVVDHWAGVYVIDPDGKRHSLIGSPHVVDNYVRDLPILMDDR